MLCAHAGFFKVLRGVNEIGIENSPIAGLPTPRRVVATTPNKALSLNKVSQMSWIIMSLLAVTVAYYI